jgi:hypothetical protein
MLAMFGELVKKLLLLLFSQIFILLCESFEFGEFKLLTGRRICIEESG